MKRSHQQFDFNKFKKSIQDSFENIIKSTQDRLNRLYKYLHDLFDFKKFNVLINEKKYNANFSLNFFIENHAPLFIVLGVFCALTYYLSTMINTKITQGNFVRLTLENCISVFISSQPDMLIQLSLWLLCIIVIIMAWVILSEIIKYPRADDEEDENLCSITNVLPNIFIRYIFFFIFYGLIFFDISYLIDQFIPDYKMSIYIISLGLQIALIKNISDKANNRTIDHFVKNYGRETFTLSSMVFILFINVFASLQDNLYVRLFVLFPCLLLLVLISYGLITIGDIFFKCIQITTTSFSRRETITNIFTIIILLVLLITSVDAVIKSQSDINNSINTNNPIIGNWSMQNGTINYLFYNDHNFTLIYNNISYNGTWNENNNTYYLNYNTNQFKNWTEILYYPKNNTICFNLSNYKY